MAEIQSSKQRVDILFLVFGTFEFWICFGLILLDASPDIRISDFGVKIGG
jgi:hypothetical protein